ncbi:MAG TPA: glycoside hydrolase domain-containing protein [Pseudogracilibacillus sp.]|nr:glycoside hydrolase domain-containing protein [Pseudogracilibacillus sp.]
MFLLLFIINGNLGKNGNDSQTGENNDSESSDQGQGEVYWGVDSAESAEDLLQCVTEEFGDPKIYGRYLGEIEGTSTSLSKNEVEFLHDQDIQVLVIYNLITEATGYDHGGEHAQKAIELAKELDVPEGVAIFGDIEPDFPVDSAFIEGWYETLDDSPYEPALYGVFDEESEILAAYNDTDETVQENTIVWTASPQKEISTEENAPEYNPQGPENAKVYGWQYAIEAEACEIDTNLFQEEMLDYVW